MTLLMYAIKNKSRQITTALALWCDNIDYICIKNNQSALHMAIEGSFLHGVNFYSNQSLQLSP